MDEALRWMCLGRDEKEEAFVEVLQTFYICFGFLVGFGYLVLGFIWVWVSGIWLGFGFGLFLVFAVGVLLTDVPCFQSPLIDFGQDETSKLHGTNVLESITCKREGSQKLNLDHI